MKRVVLVFLSLALAWMLSQGHAQQVVSPELMAQAEQVVLQLESALQEASFAWIAASFSDVQASAQQVLNILVGKSDPDYNAIAGGADVETGAMENIARLREMLQGTSWSDFSVTTDSVLAFVDWARENAKSVVRLTEEATARLEIHKAEAFLRAALGCGEGLPTTGGARTILKALQTP